MCVASNEHGLQPQKWTAILQQKKKKIAVSMPNVICMYNRHIGGVDRLDENISFYRIAIREKNDTFHYFAIS